jgi:hypothetical protein
VLTIWSYPHRSGFTTYITIPLRTVVDDPMVGQRMERPHPVDVAGDTAHRVACVEDSSMCQSQLLYQLRWTGYSSSTSEPATFVDRLDAVDEFQLCILGSLNHVGMLTDDLETQVEIQSHLNTDSEVSENNTSATTLVTI